VTRDALPSSDGLVGLDDELADVERALTRLDDGTYGRCETCGQALPDERLAVAPAARRCGGHLDLDRS
jgi:hypothetical protein